MRINVQESKERMIDEGEVICCCQEKYSPQQILAVISKDESWFNENEWDNIINSHYG